MFANIYLNEIDQYIKHKLHIKYYFRYLDDSIVIEKEKQQAINVLEKISKFLEENLQLKQGVNFCGYKINEYRMKIRDKGKRKLKNKVKKLKQQVKNGVITSKEAKKYLAGHLGYLKIANVNNLKKEIFYTK